MDYQFLLKENPFQILWNGFLFCDVKNYIKNLISTPAATAEPITPDTLLDIQY